MSEEVSSPYGAFASEVLCQYSSLIKNKTADFVFRMQELLDENPNISTILSYAPNGEKYSIFERQIDHLGSIFKPELTRIEHGTLARKMGRLYALVGIDETWIINCYNAYHNYIHSSLVANVRDLKKFGLLTSIIDSRLWIDLEEQTNGEKAIRGDHLSIINGIIEISKNAKNLADLYEGILTELSKFDGMLAIFVARLNSEGALETEAFAGPHAATYLRAMNTGQIPRIYITPTDAVLGPAAKAWISGTIETVRNYPTDGSLVPWQGFGEKLGFRSSAAMPLINADGQTFSLLSMYSAYPGFFDPKPRDLLFSYIQRVISAAAASHKQHQVIPVHTKTHYINRLTNNHITIEYQPILSLQTGKVKKFEALARLNDNDGELIFPRQFLGALSSNDMLHLFEVVLKTICKNLNDSVFNSREFIISMNFPAQGLSDLRYQRSLFSSLRSHNISGRLIELEILETDDLPKSSDYVHFLSALREAGISLVQDDLGSGYSSLLRMGTLKFDGVKIDQELVRGNLMRKPWHLLRFIHHLSELARSLGLPVTVEGLENESLVEAAAILGVDYGQGHSIAHPMPISTVQEWCKKFVWSVDHHQPKTELGLLAAYLLWDTYIKVLPNKNKPLGRTFINRTSPLYRYMQRHLHQEIIDEDLRVAIETHHKHAAAHVGDEDYKNSQDKIIDLFSTRWNSHILRHGG